MPVPGRLASEFLRASWLRSDGGRRPVRAGRPRQHLGGRHQRPCSPRTPGPQPGTAPSGPAVWRRARPAGPPHRGDRRGCTPTALIGLRPRAGPSPSRSCAASPRTQNGRHHAAVQPDKQQRGPPARSRRLDARPRASSRPAPRSRRCGSAPQHPRRPVQQPLHLPRIGLAVTAVGASRVTDGMLTRRPPPSVPRHDPARPARDAAARPGRAGQRGHRRWRVPSAGPPWRDGVAPGSPVTQIDQAIRSAPAGYHPAIRPRSYRDGRAGARGTRPCDHVRTREIVAVAHLAMAFMIIFVIASACCPGPRRQVYSQSANVARCREQLCLNLAKAPRPGPCPARAQARWRKTSCLTWTSTSVPPTVRPWSPCPASFAGPTPRGSLPI